MMNFVTYAAFGYFCTLTWKHRNIIFNLTQGASVICWGIELIPTSRHHINVILEATATLFLRPAAGAVVYRPLAGNICAPLGSDGKFIFYPKASV